MSGVRRTDNLHSIKTRDIVMQNSDGTFPARNSVLTVVDNNGHVRPSRTLALDSLICDTFSANFLGTTTPVTSFNAIDISAANISVDNFNITRLTVDSLAISSAISMSLLNVNATTTMQLIYSYNNLLRFLDSIGIVNIPKFPTTTILAGPSYSAGSLLSTTSNGENWDTYIPVGYLNTTSGIVWGNGIWVAVGTRGLSGEIVYATNTQYENTWSSAQPVSPYVFDGSGEDIGWNGQIYIATFKNATHTIWTSSDGVIWSPNETTISPPIISANRVLWTGNIWTLVANDISSAIVYTGMDGDNWTYHSRIEMKSALDVAYNGTLWVVGGERIIGNSSIYYSFGDVENWVWTAVDSSGAVFTNKTASIAWNGVMFVAVGVDDISNIPITYSRDGFSWKRVLSADIIGSLAEMFVKGTSVMWTTSGYFVAVGTDGINGYSKPAYSPDGIKWTIAGESLVPYPNLTAISHNFNTSGQYNNPKTGVVC